MPPRPTLSSAPMVRATLNGTKTQTRRIIKPQPDAVETYHYASGPRAGQPNEVLRCYQPPAKFKPCASGWSVDCPGPFRIPGQPGDQLWVRETWRTARSLDHCKPSHLREGAPIAYECDGRTNINNHERGPLLDAGRIRQSIYMRKWMSRITLQITAIRAQRLQDISEEDAEAEGVRGLYFKANSNRTEEHFQRAPDAYHHLWNSINGPASWDENPYVWVITFDPFIS